MQATQPQILRVRPANEDAIVRQAVKALKRGFLVILPTETVYGIACDPAVPGAEERLFKAKGRDRNKPVTLLVAGIKDAEKYGAVFGEIDRKLAKKFWPGPLTLVLNVRRRRSNARGPANGQLREGFRVPDCGITNKILKSAGGALRVTSANRSGEPPALTAEEALQSLGTFVEVVVDDGPAVVGTPSTVVRADPVCIQRGGSMAGRKEIIILRKGALTKSQLSKAVRR